MNLNVLQPKKAVESAFKKPNVPLALILVVLPSLASIASSIVFGAPFKVENAVYSIVLAYVAFFVLAFVIFALVAILKGSEAKGKMAGYLSALSLVKIASLAIVLLSVVAIPLCFSPAAMNAVAAAANETSPGIAVGMAAAFVEENPNAINWPLFSVFLAIAAIILILGAYLVFLGIKKLSNTGWLGAVALAIIAFIIMGVLPVI